jgi:hypothetical protein
LYEKRTNGSTVILRRKFSAQSFWTDIREHRATVFQYIGELCRYLLAVPPSPDEGKHEYAALFKTINFLFFHFGSGKE